MNKHKYILFIVEGEKAEPLILKKIIEKFFCDDNSNILVLPAARSIYALYSAVKKEDDLDIVELLKENTSRQCLKSQFDGLTRNNVAYIYLFFDCDVQSWDCEPKITKEVLQDMLKTFSNETDKGKLYVSYPMIESFYNFSNNSSCNTYTDCTISTNNEAIKKYKKDGSKLSNQNDINKFKESTWRHLFENFIMRICCLFGYDSIPACDKYKNEVSPLAVFKKQKAYIDNGEIFVLSAIPEFLLDYFPNDFWDRYITCTTINRAKCKKMPLASKEKKSK